MFKQLIQAFKDFTRGIYQADLIAMNPKEWEWMVEMYFPYQEQERIVVTSHILDGEHLDCPKWGLFRGAMFVFSDSIPTGEVWMWRMEPVIEFRSYDLQDGGRLNALIIRVTPGLPEVNLNSV